MSFDEDEGAIRRILIALDASPASMAALEAAAALAERLDADLLGLFVEDINLLRLSDLPFAREIGQHSAAANQISRERVEQQLRSQANQARRALEELAIRRKLRSHFRVARGAITEQLLQAALETDLIILGRAGWSQHQKLGSTARGVIRDNPGHTMIMGHVIPRAHPLGVIYDGSVLANRSLLIAASLLPEPDAGISVLLYADEIEQATRMQPEVEQWMEAHNLTGHIHWVHGPGGERLARLVRAEQLSLLVLPVELAGLDETELGLFLDMTQTPILLVRR